MLTAYPYTNTDCSGGLKTISCFSEKESKHRIDCYFDNPEKVKGLHDVKDLAGSSGCQYDSDVIPEFTSEDSAAFWHCSFEYGFISVCGGCKANFTFCYCKYFVPTL